MDQEKQQDETPEPVAQPDPPEEPAYTLVPRKKAAGSLEKSVAIEFYD
jgi:hypothetical protein